MVIFNMLGFLDPDESEMFRLNDRLRRNPKRELCSFFRNENICNIAVGTTRGNLSVVAAKKHLFASSYELLARSDEKFARKQPQEKIDCHASKEQSRFDFQ